MIGSQNCIRVHYFHLTISSVFCFLGVIPFHGFAMYGRYFLPKRLNSNTAFSFRNFHMCHIEGAVNENFFILTVVITIAKIR